MSTPYDVVYATFLGKIRSFDYALQDEDIVEEEMLQFMNLSASKFSEVCIEDLTQRDDEQKIFEVDLSTEDIDVLTDGMIVYWLTPYLNNSDNLSAVLNSKDYTQFSPANLVKQISALYQSAQSQFIQDIREYSYKHGDLTQLHI